MNKRMFSVALALCASVSFSFTACGGGGGGTTAPPTTPTPAPSTANEWTWVSGDNAANVNAVYSTLGGAIIATGARSSASGWRDKAGNLWLFGGSGPDGLGYVGLLADLWKYDGKWTNIGGPYPSLTLVGQTETFVGNAGVYGTLGVASISNFPGSRSGSVTWTDSSGNLWLFGGEGYDSNGTEGYLNDLWELNPEGYLTSEWTWMGGSTTANADGAYGAQGSAASGNIPGGRENAVSWTDPSGNFWLFGGVGNNAAIFNDLWEFSPSTMQWTWVSGSNTPDATGVYGTLGVAAATNVPGARYSAVSWGDSAGNLWIFGGEVFNQSTSTYAQTNDLWEFSPSTQQWTWVSGSNTPDVTGVYGTLGVAAATNVPGARYSAVSWGDSAGNLWIFGGEAFDQSTSTYAQTNDLWKFSPTTKEWTWVSGSNTPGALGVYGTLGSPSTSNVPGARSGAVSYIDGSGNLCLFGGNYASAFQGPVAFPLNGTTQVDFNDLWCYKP